MQMRNVLGRFGLVAACLVGFGCAQPTAEQVGQSHTGDEHGSNETGTCSHGDCITVLELRDEMRRLWTDHVAFTRFYLMEAIADLPGAPFTAERLLQNQDELGDAIKPFYGDAAGEELTRLLREHIVGAVAIVVAAKAGDTQALEEARAAWFANADEIARFLASANPNWTFEAIQAAMYEHLQQTIDEATARLTGDWDADVRAFDAIVAHILVLADTLTTGIAAQFPDRVSTEAVEGEQLHLAMRALWEDHVIWTRVVIISALADGVCTGDPLPDLEAAVARLLRNQDDLGNAVRPFVGDAGATQLTTLLKEHITIAAEILFAAKAEDEASLADAVARWYVNGDAIATLLADALRLPLADVQEMMRTHLDQTLTEAQHYLAARFRQSLATYDKIVRHILSMADTLSAAITNL